MKGVFSSKKKRGALHSMKRTWFFYITLPLFLFMLTYRTMECVIYNLMEKNSGLKEQEDKGGTDAKKSRPVPLAVTSFPTESVPVRPAGEPLKG